jgi:hypothetical protein
MPMALPEETGSRKGTQREQMSWKFSWNPREQLSVLLTNSKVKPNPR